MVENASLATILDCKLDAQLFAPHFYRDAALSWENGHRTRQQLPHLGRRTHQDALVNTYFEAQHTVEFSKEPVSCTEYLVGGIFIRVPSAIDVDIINKDV